MKKNIREEIKALAQKIIDSDSNFKASKVKDSVKELYEKLTVLEYLEHQIDDYPDDVKEESLDSKSFREENWFTEPVPVPQSKHKEDLIEPLMEKIKDIVAQMPEESERVDRMLEEVLPKQKYTKNDIEEFASNYQQMPTFERKDTYVSREIEETPAAPVAPPEPIAPVVIAPEPVVEPTPEPILEPTPEPVVESKPEPAPVAKVNETVQRVPQVNSSLNDVDPKSKSLNDRLHGGMNIGLNDRIAFVKHLFEGQTEDFNRVLSQVNTMQNFEEAQHFIKVRVKPDHKFWIGKEIYAERFMNIVEKSFQ